MKKDSNYHHGNLRVALLRAASQELERSGYEALSLRELAASLDVSRSAPYRHFDDRRALLSALATDGFDNLTAAYEKASQSRKKSGRARLADAGRAYLDLAAKRPQLFRLMFASDLLQETPFDEALGIAAGRCYQTFERLVADSLHSADPKAVKATTIAVMSCTHGFALLRSGDRLKPFMLGELTPAELVDAVLSVEVPNGFSRARDR